MSPEKINGVKTAVISNAVKRIERKHGACPPGLLVEAARSDRSPLHRLFEWDDNKAASDWRTHQARLIINKIRVVVDEERPAVPAFVHVREITEDGVIEGYMSTARVMASPARDGVLRDALSQLQGLRRRYEALSELAPVWEALDELERVAA